MLGLERNFEFCEVYSIIQNNLMKFPPIFTYVVEILIYIKDEIMTSKIEKVIVDSLLELNEELENSELNNPTKETKLYGGNGVLDSLALVSFITDLEERISDEFDEDIILADEKAMSQRTSPFRNVETLATYIQKLLEE